MHKTSDASDVVTGYALVNGRRTVYINVTKRADASTLDVVQRVKRELPRMQSLIPDDIKLEFLFDQSIFVTNALRYGRTPISVKAVQNDRHFRLTVEDQGVGISAEDLPHIFERFYRSDKARQRLPGRASSGLGLSICQTIVQALEGTIEVSSAAGQGSTFTVSLPLAAESSAPSSSRERLESPAA